MDASHYCRSQGLRARHAFALSAASPALVLTSMTCQVPVLSQAAAAEGAAAGDAAAEEEEEGAWRFDTAVSHRLPVTAVDWHPKLNVIVSGSADHTVALTCLDL